MLGHATMSYGGGQFEAVDLAIPSPGSPPGMSSSKSSKASSLHSFNSDEDNSVTADVGHFEEIGLEDDSVTIDSTHLRDTQIRSSPNPYSPNFTADLRAASAKHVGSKMHQRPRELGPRPRPQRPITQVKKTRPSPLALAHHFRDTSTNNLTSLGREPHMGPSPIRGLSIRSASSISDSRRRRSPSPNLAPMRSLSPRGPNTSGPRRSSPLSSRGQRSIEDLEKECEDDDDDDIPDGIILDNVPLSPRPPMDRPASRPASASTSPERQPKERVRSVGNGTPPVAVAQGSLRSPTWKTDHIGDAQQIVPSSPMKGRAKSWTAAISYLNADAKELTEKLEEHADELEKHGIHSSYERPAPKPRVKSALAELPPLRRTNIMIDPLPISKEKEAVLSRTRPSWLPPKNPAEEKKHLKEYQKMMASSIEAEKKREAMRKEKEQSKDKSADALMHVWENGVLQRWDDAMRDRRTRELWWKGVAPRSRGAVWARAIGNDLGLTEASFQAALGRAQEAEERAKHGKASTEDERRMGWFEQIQSDVQQQTWVDLKIFQKGAPLHQSLVDILCAYVMYRSDIGYVTGCNAIAALLLLNLPTPGAAFVALANILNRPISLSFLALDTGAKASAYNLVNHTLSIKSPQLHRHLNSEDSGLESDAYLGGIFTSLFTSHLTLDQCTRLWDVYVFEGDAILIRAAVAILLDHEMSLLSAKTTSEIQKVLRDPSNASSHGTGDEWVAKLRAAGKS
ncbi:TBC domain-containing protein [Xylariomycetidae sp. FL2044]|nr:TBC domain-containing protein [Xylariomycetidae sp. FL2044]